MNTGPNNIFGNGLGGVCGPSYLSMTEGGHRNDGVFYGTICMVQYIMTLSKSMVLPAC